MEKPKKRLLKVGDNDKLQTIELSLSELKILQNQLLKIDSNSYNIDLLRKKLEYYITNLED
jgi:hypothetical protein